MSIKRLLLFAVLTAMVAGAAAVYVGLIMDGSVPPPDLQKLAGMFFNGTASALQMVAVVAIGAAIVMAAVAPIIYAARSHDIITVLISLAMTSAALGMVFIGKTVFDNIIALMIYIANMILAAIVYASHRIAPKDDIVGLKEPTSRQEPSMH